MPQISDAKISATDLRDGHFEVRRASQVTTRNWCFPRQRQKKIDPLDRYWRFPPGVARGGEVDGSGCGQSKTKRRTAASSMVTPRPGASRTSIQPSFITMGS